MSVEILKIYLMLCETIDGIRWYEISSDPLMIQDRATHFGPFWSDNDHYSIIDKAVGVANANDFSLEDEDTWPLES